MGDIAADVAYGRIVVEEGGLTVLRELLGLSRNAMANLLYVSLATYTRWEIDPQTQLSPGNAGHIGRFYRLAQNQVEYMIEDGIDPRKIKPLHDLARDTGTPTEVLHQRYRNGELDCYDLGILGLWVKK